MKLLKRKDTYIVLAILILFGTVLTLNKQKKDANPYKEFDHASARMATLKPEKEYFVYYYEVNNPDCIKIVENIISFADTNTMYFVNMDNENTLYDWKSFHTENDKEIGQYIDDEIVYYENESEDIYINSTEVNPYGKVRRYEIIVADNDYLTLNKNAKLGYVYAKQLVPEIDYLNHDIAEMPPIAGVPTLLHFNGPIIDQFYFGSEDIQSFLKQVE